MGAWGEGPMDNDSALDWVDQWRYNTEAHDFHPDKHWMKSVPEDAVLAALQDRGDYWEEPARAAAVVVARTQKFVHLKPMALRTLHDVLANREFIDSWKSTKAIVHSIQEQIKELEGGTA